MRYHIEDGVLFIDDSESLSHHGVLGMKWGKHLRAGKGPVEGSGGGGGGAPEEEDEETKKKIEEAAKKAGVSVDAFRKIAGNKVAEIKKAAYNAAGGKYKDSANALYKDANRQERVAEDNKREQSSLHGSSNRKREAANRWDEEAKSAAATAKTANQLSGQADNLARAYEERAKAKKSAAEKAKTPKMNRDPSTTHNPFGADGVRKQDARINRWADDITRNNSKTRAGIRREFDYEKPKREFEKAAQDAHNGKKNVTLSEGAAAYALAREQQAVRRRRHSGTVGEGDRKKASELRKIKKESDESGAVARRAQQEAKKIGKRIRESSGMDSLYAGTSGKVARVYGKLAKETSEEARKEKSKYEKSLAGKYDRAKKKVKTAMDKKRVTAASSGQLPHEKKRVAPSKLDKARYAFQRGKQRAYNAAGGKYKEGAKRQEVLYKRAEARKNRATKMYNKTTNPSYDWDRQAADSAMRIHNYEAAREYAKYRQSLAGRYDRFKAKRKKKAKHFDDTNAVYTVGTRLIINSKWG